MSTTQDQISKANEDEKETEVQILHRKLPQSHHRMEEPSGHITVLEAIAPSFPKFNQLPPELRIMIWEWSFIPRVLSIHSVISQMLRKYLNDPQFDQWIDISGPRTMQQPAVSAVNSISRSVFQKHYKRCDWPGLLGRTNYINFAIDTIALGDSIEAWRYPGFDMGWTIKPQSDTEGIRRLAITWSRFKRMSFERMEGESTITEIFPQLEELFIMDRDEVEAVWNDHQSRILIGWMTFEDGGEAPSSPSCELIPREFQRNPTVKFVSVEDKYKGASTWKGKTVWDRMTTQIAYAKTQCRGKSNDLDSLRVNLVATALVDGPYDYDPNYIVEGPACERNAVEDDEFMRALGGY